MIQIERRNGNDQKDAFINICSQVDLNPPPKDKLIRWFKMLEQKNDDLRNEIDYDSLFELLKLVGNEYAMLDQVKDKKEFSFTANSVFLPNLTKTPSNHQFVFDIQTDNPASLLKFNYNRGNTK